MIFVIFGKRKPTYRTYSWISERFFAPCGTWSSWKKNQNSTQTIFYYTFWFLYWWTWFFMMIHTSFMTFQYEFSAESTEKEFKEISFDLRRVWLRQIFKVRIVWESNLWNVKLSNCIEIVFNVESNTIFSKLTRPSSRYVLFPSWVNVKSKRTKDDLHRFLIDLKKKTFLKQRHEQNRWWCQFSQSRSIITMISRWIHQSFKIRKHSLYFARQSLENDKTMNR